MTRAESAAEARRARAAAVDAYYRDLIPRALELWGGGSTLAEVAERLNAEGRPNRLGRPWTATNLEVVLRRYANPEARAVRSNAGRGRKARDYSQAVAEYYRPLVPHLVEPWAGGHSQAAIAER